MTNLLKVALVAGILSSCNNTADTPTESSEANVPKEASQEDGEISALFIVDDTKNKIPECNEQRNGYTVFLKSSKSFRFCGADGWEDLDGLRGASCSVKSTKSGATISCEDGTESLIAGGKSGSATPTDVGCSVTKNGAESKITCHDGSSATVTDGQSITGPAGSNCSATKSGLTATITCGASNVSITDGTNGAQGTQGTAGTAGSPGRVSLIKLTSESPGSNCPAGGKKIESGIDNGDGAGTAGNNTLEAGEVDATTYLCASGAMAVFTSTNVLVGSVSGNNIILPDGKVAQFGFGSGKYIGTYAYSSTGNVQDSYCLFTSNDCSGTCFAQNTAGGVVGVAKNTVYFSGSAFFYADGTEVDSGSQTFHSNWRNETCNVATTNVTKSFPITNPYTLPGGLTHPLVTPLYYGTYPY